MYCMSLENNTLARITAVDLLEREAFFFFVLGTAHTAKVRSKVQISYPEGSITSNRVYCCIHIGVSNRGCHTDPGSHISVCWMRHYICIYTCIYIYFLQGR